MQQIYTLHLATISQAAVASSFAFLDAAVAIQSVICMLAGAAAAGVAAAAGDLSRLCLQSFVADLVQLAVKPPCSSHSQAASQFHCSLS